jgi:hypothetical protein
LKWNCSYRKCRKCPSTDSFHLFSCVKIKSIPGVNPNFVCYNAKLHTYYVHTYVAQCTFDRFFCKSICIQIKIKSSILVYSNAAIVKRTCMVSNTYMYRFILIQLGSGCFLQLYGETSRICLSSTYFMNVQNFISVKNLLQFSVNESLSRPRS